MQFVLFRITIVWVDNTIEVISTFSYNSEHTLQIKITIQFTKLRYLVTWYQIVQIKCGGFHFQSAFKIFKMKHFIRHTRLTATQSENFFLIFYLKWRHGKFVFVYFYSFPWHSHFIVDSK